MNNSNSNNDERIGIERQDSMGANIPNHNQCQCDEQHRHHPQPQRRKLQQKQLLQQQQQQHNRHHLKAVSNLTNGINRIAVNYSNNNNNKTTYEVNGESKHQNMMTSRKLNHPTNSDDDGLDDVDGMAGATRTEERGGVGSVETEGVKFQTTESDDCDRSQQSSISGSWDGMNNRGGSALSASVIESSGVVSSFRSLAGRKAYSPRWMDRKSGVGDNETNTRNHRHHTIKNWSNHNYQRMMSSSSADGGGYTSLTEDSASQNNHYHRHHHVASVDSSSFSVVERKRSRNREDSFSSKSDKEASTEVRQFRHHHQENCTQSQVWSTSTRTDTTVNDSHDEGSSTAEGGYHSGGGSHSVSVGVGGYPSFHHPELSFAASVKSDIATVCSGSVLEDIDMAEEIGSVASDNRKAAALPHNTKGLEFASNILNDMGPPQALCSALLLAANAACRPSSSHCSLHSFDTNEGGTTPGSDAVSDVVAHLDTDDCCDRSIESEVSTLHSQDEMMSDEHMRRHLDKSARMTTGAKGLLHHTSDPSSLNGRNCSRVDYNLPFQRFRQCVLQQGVGEQSQYLNDGNFSPPEFVGDRGEDDWSNSRSHSRSPSRSLGSSSSRSRSRSRSRSPGRTQPSWRERDYHNSPITRSLRASRDAERHPTEEMIEDDYRVEFSSNPNL